MKRLIFILLLLPSAVWAQSVGSGFAQRGGSITGITSDGDTVTISLPAVFEALASFESTVNITLAAGENWVLASDGDSLKFDLGTELNAFHLEFNDSRTVDFDSTGKAIFQTITDATTSFQWLDADGGTPILNIDATNERAGFGTASPGNTVEVVGTIEASGNSAQMIVDDNSNPVFFLKAGGVNKAFWQIISDDMFFDLKTANQSILFRDNANITMLELTDRGSYADLHMGGNRFRIAEDDTLTVQGGEGNPAIMDFLADQGDDAADTVRFSVADGGTMTVTGNTVFQPRTDATTSFQWLDADGGTPILNIDATNERVGIGTASPATTIELIHTGDETEGLPAMGANDIAAFAHVSAAGDNANFHVLSGNTGNAAVYLGDSDAIAQGGMRYDNNSSTLALYAAGSSRATLTSTLFTSLFDVTISEATGLLDFSGATSATISATGTGKVTIAADDTLQTDLIKLETAKTLGQKTFDNAAASADTVANTDGTTDSRYFVAWASDPGAPADWWVEAKTDTLILHTGAAVTGTPSYNWMRLEE